MKNMRLKGIKNIRGLGGRNGEGKIKSGLIFRSGELSRIDDKSLRKLKELGIKTIIDLRTDEEVSEKEDAIGAEFDYLHIPVFSSKHVGVVLDKKSRENLKADDFPTMESIYATMASNSCLESFKKVIREIMERSKNGGVLFHCTSGKDRTGLVAFLLESILGLDDEYKKKDYLFSNKVGKKKANALFILVFLRKFDIKLARNVRNAYLVKGSYLRSFVSNVEKEYGNVESYIRKGLGLSVNEIDSFRMIMLIDKQ